MSTGKIYGYTRCNQLHYRIQSIYLKAMPIARERPEPTVQRSGQPYMLAVNGDPPTSAVVSLLRISEKLR